MGAENAPASCCSYRTEYSSLETAANVEITGTKENGCASLASGAVATVHSDSAGEPNIPGVIVLVLLWLTEMRR